MRKRSLLGIITAIILCTTAAGATSPELEFLVDHRAISLPVPAHLENGYTVVPLRVLAEALGAQVDYVDNGNGTATVHLNSYPLLFSPPFGTGSAHSDRSAPADLQGLGASSALTQYLATEQATSLTGSGPAMVRFELLDMMSTCGFPPPQDPSQFCAGGFRFGVRLYYAQLEASGAPANVATYQYILAENQMVTGAGSVGRQATSSWYEDVILDVKPTGTPAIRREGNVIKIEYGAQGWAVDPASKVSKQKVTLERSPYLVHGSYAR